VYGLHKLIEIVCRNISFIHFHARFSFEEGRGDSSPSLGGLKTRYDFQQYLIVLLAPQQDVT